MSVSFLGGVVWCVLILGGVVCVCCSWEAWGFVDLEAWCVVVWGGLVFYGVWVSVCVCVFCFGASCGFCFGAWCVFWAKYVSTGANGR